MSRRKWLRLSRALVLGLGVAVLSWPSGAGSSLAAAAAAVGAALLAERLSGVSFRGARPRIAAVWLAAIVLLGAGLALAQLGAGSNALARALGPAAVIRLSESLLWISATAPLVFALHFTARRRPLAAVAEALLVAGCFVGALAAHRNGLISRPFALGDWGWQLGIDPTLLLLACGGIATLLLAALLVAEERASRMGVYLGVLAVVALVLVGVVRLDALPTPDPPGAGEAREQERKSRQGAAARPRSADPWEFQEGLEGAQDEAPVAVVVLHDDYEPNSGAYYFRQSALSQFNGRRLVQATRDDVDRDVLDFFPAEPTPLAAAPEPSEHRMPLRTTTGLLVDHVRPFALDAPVSFEPADRGSARFQRTYAALSLVQTVPYAELLGRAPDPDDWTAAQREHYTSAPDDSRYAELAREIREGLRDELRDDPLGQALGVKLYLDEAGVYSYANRHADSDDPTASFLFGDLKGYCVHFAHAATFLLRTLGVPARVATGYAVQARDGYGGSAILIRSLNAHAWPEVYVSGLGWVVVDPVPQRSEVATAPPIDPELQRMLGELLREKDGVERVADRLAGDREWLASMLRLLIAAGAIALAVGYGGRAYRRLVPAVASPRDRPRVAYRAALDRLAGVGWRRRPGESREAFARRVRHVAPSFVSLTGAHLRSAFGRADTGEPTELRVLDGSIAVEIRAAVPSWRRALALLDPFTWMRVH